MSRVLVVEDDADIGALVGRYLQKAGHVWELERDGGRALARVESFRPDLLILDLMLPGLSGTGICAALRSSAATSALPIIMLTAKGEESDRIHGLEVGADDYVTKPFSPNELVARVKALLRRTTREPAEQVLRHGPIVMDLARHTIAENGREVRLTAKEFLLLQYLMEHRGRVLSRDRLLSDVWDYSYTGATRTVDVHVRRLREKLPFLERSLVTVQQFGYRLLDPAPSSP
jgi:two-component system, OmpR family, alkaline phosphatase synthesis response regulator PhoP